MKKIISYLFMISDMGAGGKITQKRVAHSITNLISRIKKMF